MPFSRIGSEFVYRTSVAGVDSQYERLIALSDGRFLVTWQRSNANAPAEVMAQYFNSNGTPASSVFALNTQVSTSEGLGFSVRLANGSYVATVLTTDSQGYSYARATMFDVNGNVVSPNLALVEIDQPGLSESFNITDVVALANGGFVVTATEYTIFADALVAAHRVFDANGNPVTNWIKAADSNRALMKTPEAAALTSGQYVVAWTDRQQADGDTSGYAVLARIFNANGTPATTDFIVNSTFAGDQTIADVVGLKNGQFAVGFFEANPATTNLDNIFRIKIFNANGIAVTGEITVSQTASHLVEMEALPDGRLLVVYTDDVAGGPDVKAVVHNADGSISVPAFTVNTDTLGWQQLNNVEVMADGKVLITWIDRDGVNRGQLFDPTSGASGTAGNDTFTGSAEADTYDGLAGDDWINGLGGNDTLSGGDGNDNLLGGAGADALNGGNGYDNARYDYASGGVTVALYSPRSNTGEAAGDTFVGIEGVVGSAYNDVLYGDSNANFLAGLGGDDWLDGISGGDHLYGGDGNDHLMSRAGVQILDGGNGFDTARYDNAASGVAVVLYNTALNAGEAAGDTFASIEGLVGSSFNDWLYGDASANFLHGLAGADWLDGVGGSDYIYGGDGDDGLVSRAGAQFFDGGNGLDSARYDYATSGVSVVLYNASLNTGEAAGDTYVSIEGVVGSIYNDYLYGEANTNFLYGTAGNDWLDGIGGSDYLYGGEGNDFVVFDSADNLAYVLGGAGTDTLVFNGIPAPTSFSLTGHEFERAEGRYVDTASNSWSSYTNIFTASWQLDYAEYQNDNRTRTVVDHDQANSGAWQTIYYGYDTLGRLAYADYVNDDRSRVVVDFDETNANSWQAIHNGYDAAGRLSYSDYIFDNGQRTHVDYDETNSNNWRAIYFGYDARDRLAYADYAYDNGTRTLVDFDETSQYSWSYINYQFNAAGVLVNTTFVPD
jgi:Ca2+-binding RTX toxin-like protein